MVRPRFRMLALLSGAGVVVLAAILVPVMAMGQPDERETDGGTAVRLVEQAQRLLADSDVVVARVNGAPISLGQLNLGLAASRDNAMGRDEVLDQLIAYELLYQEGIRLGLAPSDAEVQAAIDQNRSLVAPELVEAAIQAANEAGSDLDSADEYWNSPELKDGTRKSITVGNARDAIIAGVEPAERDAALAERVAELRAAADIEILEENLPG